MYVLLISVWVIFLTVRDTPMGNCSDGDIRLVGGSNLLQGRVEICVNNAWGTVCGDSFSDEDASVVCNSIGQPYTRNIESSTWCQYLSNSHTVIQMPRCTQVMCLVKALVQFSYHLCTALGQKLRYLIAMHSKGLALTSVYIHKMLL